MHRRSFALGLIGTLIAVPAVAQVSAPDSEMFPRHTTVMEPYTSFQTAVTPKQPGTSALLSLLITGAGQFYNEEVVKGAIMLALGVGFTVLAVDGIDEFDCDATEDCVPALLPIGLTGALVVKIWSIVDASAGARRWNVAHGVAGLRVAPALGLRRFAGGETGVNLVRVSF